jgi:hypothetical protein
MAVVVRLNPKILPAALALGLLALGIPQTGDSVLWLMAGDTPDQPGAASPGSVDATSRNAALLERADDWFGDPRARIRAGILRMRLATTGTGPDGKPAVSTPELEHAIADLTDGLMRAPANAIGWAALAQASLANGDRPRARVALSTSLLIDNNDPDLSLWRCELGLALWSYFNNDERRMWNNQVILAMRNQPGDLVDLAHQNGGVNALLIRLALLSDQTHLDEYDHIYSQYFGNH